MQTTRSVVSRSQAQALGLARYFTGKPCKAGHTTERYVASWHCVECVRAIASERYRADAEHRRQRSQYQKQRWQDPAFRAAQRVRKGTPAAIAKQRDRFRRWQENNREARSEYQARRHRERYQADPDYRARSIAHGRKRQSLKRAGDPDARGETVTIAEIIERDGGICQLCETAVNLSAASPSGDSPSFDHIVPLSKGGTHTRHNLQLAHLRCNKRKGNRERMVG